MKALTTKLDGVYLIENFVFEDYRGTFVKAFTHNETTLKNLNFQVQEIYFSVSHKGVLRGMHFQRPPMDHAKFIYLVSGTITDVLLDLRKSSATYQQHAAFDISKEQALYIPAGIAHGFVAHEEQTVVVYNQSSPYSKEHDEGVLWNSFGYDWGVVNPTISVRDRAHPPLSEYESPFE